MVKWTILIMLSSILSISSSLPESNSNRFQRETLELNHKIAELEESLYDVQEAKCLLENEITTLQDNFVDNLCLRDQSIDPRISSKFKNALENYEQLEGPIITITSFKRNYNPKSAHYYGNGGDIRFDKQGEKFLRWTSSDVGKQWMEEFGIKVLLEFPNTGRMQRKWAKRYPGTIVNGNATGIHIHIEIKNTV